MSDLSEISKAIQASNDAFEQFKISNDARLVKMAGDKGSTDEMSAMHKAFDALAAESKAAREKLENYEAKASRRNLGGGKSDDSEDVTAHKSAFGSYLRKGKEFDLSIEQKALGLSTSGGADGGYAVPKVIDGDIEALLINISPMRSLAKVIQIGTSDYHKLVNLRGTSSGWVGETAARPATNTPLLADIKPTMGELYANPQATQQMLDDVFFNAETWLAGEVATEFARAEGAAFITGTGVNQPTGFIGGLPPVATDDATRLFGTLQYVPTGVAGAFATTNPVDVFYTLVGKVKAGYRQGSKFLTNKQVLFQVAAMKDPSGRYIFTPVQSPSVPTSILGYEVVEAEDMPGVAAGSLSLAFGNFPVGYLIVDRMGMRVIRDPFSNKPYIGFYSTKRVGGSIINSEAIKVLKFSVT